jgi:hypothetical protein
MGAWEADEATQKDEEAGDGIRYSGMRVFVSALEFVPGDVYVE